MDGILRCSRYAFGPNRLHYCGPDANREIFGYIKTQRADFGLAELMRGFKTMYPYLRLIARANRITDPFDTSVVEAYWIGNELLENVSRQQLYTHLVDEQNIKARVGSKSFALVEDKIAQRAIPHHSFHVLDIWKRTGNLDIEHTLESMDSCRISWGKVIEIEGPKILVETQPLIQVDNKLQLGTMTRKTVLRQLQSDTDIEQLQPGQIITMHWGVPCEVIAPKQAKYLKDFTLKHLALANQTI